MKHHYECNKCGIKHGDNIEGWTGAPCLYDGCDGKYENVTPLPQYIQEKRMECWVKSAISSTSINNALPPTEYADLMLAQFDKTFNINQPDKPHKPKWPEVNEYKEGDNSNLNINQNP